MKTVNHVPTASCIPATEKQHFDHQAVGSARKFQICAMIESLCPMKSLLYAPDFGKCRYLCRPNTEDHCSAQANEAPESTLHYGFTIWSFFCLSQRSTPMIRMSNMENLLKMGYNQQFREGLQ